MVRVNCFKVCILFTYSLVFLLNSYSQCLTWCLTHGKWSAWQICAIEWRAGKDTCSSYFGLRDSNERWYVGIASSLTQTVFKYFPDLVECIGILYQRNGCWPTLKPAEPWPHHLQLSCVTMGKLLPSRGLHIFICKIQVIIALLS